MTLTDFIKKYEGKYADFDGWYGAQCVDLVQFYNKEVVGGSFLSGANAYDIWTTYPKDKYTAIENTPDGVPQAGDIVIWGKAYGIYGHIAIFIEGDVNKLTCFSQNDPTGSPSVRKLYSSYRGIIGWLRPKLAVTQPTMTEQQKKDIESMENLRKYRGTWYESKDVIRDWELLEAEKRDNNKAWDIERAKLKQDIANEKEAVSRLDKRLLEQDKAWRGQTEALEAVILEKEKGTATLQDTIRTLQKQVDFEAKEKGKALSQLAECQAGNKPLSVAELLVRIFNKLKGVNI